MRTGEYIKDKGIEILLSLVLLIISIWLMVIFGLSTPATIIIGVLMVITELGKIFYDYFRKRKFYSFLRDNTERLDKAYLVLETLEKPGFYEGLLIYDILYEINKSMAENVNVYVKNSKAYMEYIEVWIHEVKLPLSAISLRLHNMINADNEWDEKTIESFKKIQSEVSRITEYVDQVLYYSRSENAEKDYHISRVSLGSIVHSTAMDFRETLLDNKIDLKIDINADQTIITDTKWLKFILGQIISNSIKYRKQGNESYIRIYSEIVDKSLKLYIEDNGLGIAKEDLNRVFEKSFTGKNGKTLAQSTGMGLYIVKELCGKLEHEISVESEESKWTRICLTLQTCNVM